MAWGSTLYLVCYFPFYVACVPCSVSQGTCAAVGKSNCNQVLVTNTNYGIQSFFRRVSIFRCIVTSILIALCYLAIMWDFRLAGRDETDRFHGVPSFIGPKGEYQQPRSKEHASTEVDKVIRSLRF